MPIILEMPPISSAHTGPYLGFRFGAGTFRVDRRPALGKIVLGSLMNREFLLNLLARLDISITVSKFRWTGSTFYWQPIACGVIFSMGRRVPMIQLMRRSSAPRSEPLSVSCTISGISRKRRPNKALDWSASEHYFVEYPLKPSTVQPTNRTTRYISRKATRRSINKTPTSSRPTLPIRKKHTIDAIIPKTMPSL